MTAPGTIAADVRAGGIRRFRRREGTPPQGDHVIGGAWTPAPLPIPPPPPPPPPPPGDSILLDTWTGAAVPAPTFTFTRSAPAGALLSVVVGDGFGHVPTLSAVSDSRGNAYEIDSDANEPSGDGSCYVAHSELATAIEAGDTITVTFDVASDTSFEIIATPFVGPTALDAAGVAVGFFGTGSVPVSVTGSPGDLLIAYAVSDGGTIAPDSGWTTFILNESDGFNGITAVWKLAASDTATFEVVGGRYGAAVACAYR